MTATVEEKALLAAILAEPGEDTHRLAYADWLQEHGQEARAEFIRVQCGLYGPPRYTRMHAIHIAERLLADHGARWADVPGFCFDTVQTAADATEDADLSHAVAVFSRGFVGTVRVTAANWLAQGDAISAAHPVTKVCLTTPFEWDGDEDGAWLVGDPKQAHVPWTDIQAEATPEEHDRRHLLPALFRCRWPGVTFELPTWGIDWAGGNPAADIASALQQMGLGPGHGWAHHVTGLPTPPT